MHLLYLDESGSASDPTVDYFVLAGVSFFERNIHWVEKRLNGVVSSITSGDIHDIELHGSPMHGGRGAWRRVKPEVRRKAISDALVAGVGSYQFAQVFAAVVKRDACGSRDVVELAFEEICMRFDLYLAALHRQKDTQRGIIIFDKCSTENRIQKLARDFKYTGHSRGMTRNYAEVPMFLDSKASRLIQLADLIAYSIFRRYQHGDSTYYDLIEARFHSSGGVRHGLYECIEQPIAPSHAK